MELLRAGPRNPVAQNGDVTWAAKIGDEDLRLDWDRPAAELQRQVRLGRAWTTLDGERFRVLGATVVPGHAGPPGVLGGLVVGTGSGGLLLDEVQAPGRRALPGGEWQKGARLPATVRFGT